MKSEFLFIQCLILVSPLLLNCQEIDEKLLCKKWTIDVELMRPVVEDMLSKRPDMADLDEVNRKVAIQTALNKITNNTVEYKANGVRTSFTSKGTSKSTWTYHRKKNELVVLDDNKLRSKFTIIKLTSNSLHLISENGTKLFFKPN